ncbi:MAG: hypothetical protein QF464_08035, partial [Myxococcota bacterium]|nr:hypothetical protein [Myxococcota bacterium]
MSDTETSAPGDAPVDSGDAESSDGDSTAEPDATVDTTTTDAVETVADTGETVADTPPTESPSMYNRRYCEVLGVTLDLATMTASADVYNSLPFGTCPQAQWEALDAATLAEQLGVDQVMLNGPRYFVVDSGSGSTLSAGTVETFGEITMMLLAT